MAISKGATVIHVNGDPKRKGEVLREVAPHVVKIYDGAEQRTARFEVRFAADAARNVDAHTGTYTEDELKVIPRDSRTS